MAKSRVRPFLPGHASKTNSEANRKGHAAQASKIRGENNPSKQNREKLSVAAKAYWDGLTDKEREARKQTLSFVKNPFTGGGRYKRRSDGFRSVLEKRIAQGLTARGVSFKYEKHRKFYDGKGFYPDFTLPDGTIVEVSGYAYPNWQKEFNKKIRKIVKSGYKVVCVTYMKQLETLRKNVSVPVYSIRGFLRASINYQKT